MARPFSISEFMETTCTLKSIGATLGSDGGYTKSPVLKDTFTASFMPLSASKTVFSGSQVLDASHYALTDDTSISVANGDVVTVDGVNYEVVAFDDVATAFGAYICVYLKVIHE